MTETFRVRNFARFQHYKDRAPPWIKLYNELLDDYGFARLPDATKIHLVLIWLLASRSENTLLPLDPLWIAKRISATETVDLERLLASGFIERWEGEASDPLAACKQDASPERETEAEREAEREAETETDMSAAADASPRISRLKKDRITGHWLYPQGFEEFWRAYPVDALMSKAKAYGQWRRLSAVDRAAAQGSLAAFRAYCAKEPTYRPVHPERYLSQRRFEGFNAEAAKPVPVKDASGLAAEWGGKARLLVAAIGAAQFAAWFSGSEFSDGPPATITVEKPFAAEWIKGHFSADLRRLFGEVKVEVRR